MSAIESALLNQNVYADFVSEYLRSSSARTPLSHISEMEQSARVHDIRYDSRVAQSPIARFFVLPTRYSYDSQANYHSGANSEDATGADSIAGRRYIMSSILRGKNPDAFTAKTSLPTVLPSKADVASNDLSNQWESELLTLKDTKRTTQSTGDKLFTDFKRFVERKYAAGEIALEGVVGERLDALEKALHEEGLEKAEEGFKNLRPQIGRNLLAEMDKHRAFISDSLELTLLSRELPDRLLVYRAIVSDPQVEEARKLLTGSITKLGLTDTGEVNSVIKDPITTTPTITMESPTSESKVPELGAVLVKRVPALS